MTTVGYGDYFPRSHLGRFVGVFACIIGMLILSLMVWYDFTENEKKAFYKLKRLSSDDSVKEKAKNVISMILILNRMNKRKKTIENNTMNVKFIMFLFIKKEIKNLMMILE